MVQSVYAKCIGIKNYLKNYDESEFLIALKLGFEKTLKIKLKNGNFSNYELELAEELTKKKYSNERWLNRYE